MPIARSDAGSDAGQHGAAMRPLLLGAGWFPEELGGLERYYRDLFLALRNAGLEPSGIVIGPGATAPPEVEVVSDREAPLWRRLWAYWRAAQRIADRVDMVHVHFALYALPVLWLGRLRHKPVVVQFQGPWAEEAWQAGDRSRAHRWLRRRLETFVYRRADVVLTLSGAFKQVLVEQYGISPWRIRVSPPGVDVARFGAGDRAAARAHLSVASETFLAVVARRLVPRTGVHVLLEAWRHVEDRTTGELLVVGDGPDRRMLERRAKELGLRGVRFMGAVPDALLRDCYAAADLNVVPTLAHEGFGLVVIEAAAAGCPSVVSDVDALPEAVGEIGASLVVPAGDPSALGSALVRAATSPELLPARDRWRSHAEAHSWDRAVLRTRQAYADATRREAAPRPRVVYLDHVARMSGGEIALARLLDALEDVDKHVILAEHGPLETTLRKAGCSVEVLPLGDGTRDLRRDSLARGLPGLRVAVELGAYSFRLWRRLRALRPDVVHANSLKSGFYGSVSARAARIPVVWHLRDRVAADYLPSRAAAVTRAAVRRLPTAVVANSEETLSTVQPLPAGLSGHVLPDPLRLPVKTSTPQEHDRLTVGMVGRIAPWKGQALFLEAFARAFPDGDARAVIVGGPLFGEEECYRALQREVERSGLAERVRLTGHVQDVESQLQGFDILVHASLVPEPFGQVVLEGMAWGLPVVAAAAGGPAELISSGTDGLLYPPGDSAALSAALQRLAGDPSLRRTLGDAARERARAFSPDVIGPKMAGIYAGLGATTARNER